MNTNEPETTWKNLLSLSAPTFSAAAEPPYGFVTNTLAVLRAEARQQREFERIGWRAFLASLAALGMAAVVAVTVNLHQQNATDFDPGVRSLVQVDSLPYS
jgi:hypothetical protein